ncbi:MAG: hypothetical protein H7145_21980 [Akkermansiaceae bacterium]|nr:hypothetical protein [Armatimonadota bacterium]
MKVFFLGTGAAEGFPALFCSCGVCALARTNGGKDRRLRTGVLIDDTVRIDLSPDTLAQVHAYPQLSLSGLENLLFTHTHDDHFAVRELQYLSPNFAPCRDTPVRVWGTEYLLGRIRVTMGKFFEPAPLVLTAVAPFQTYPVAHLVTTPIPSHHKDDELCLNYLLTEPETGKTLLYASDTGWYHAPTWEFLAGRRLDAVVLECGLGGSDAGYEGHLSLAGCVSVREKLVAEGGLAEGAPFYLTHISHTGLLCHDELSERAAPHGISVAYDGLELVF